VRGPVFHINRNPVLQQVLHGKEPSLPKKKHKCYAWVKTCSPVTDNGDRHQIAEKIAQTKQKGQ
jgi:hypothetical protein